MSSLAELQVACRKRDFIDSELKCIEALVKQDPVKLDKYEITVKLEDMPRIRSEYKQLFFEIMLKESTDESDVSGDTSSLSAFEVRWSKTISKLKKIVESFETPSSSGTSSTASLPIVNPQSNQVNVRLPVINLPEFSGAYKDWSPLYESFKSLIHENNNLDDC